MRNFLRQFTIQLATMLAVGCGYDTTYTGPTSPPVATGLWTASPSQSAILRLATSQLDGTGALAPATRITTGSADLAALVGIAFDAAGNLWVASEEDSRLIEFAPYGLAASGSAAAMRVISSNAGSLSGPSSLAFDPQHRLWVANRASGTLVRFDPAQLAQDGAPVPAVTLTGLGLPTAIAFDAAGRLWVTDNRTNTVSGYAAAQLVASGSPEPAVVLGATRQSLIKPSGLAFDAAGTLWVANTNGESISGYRGEQLTVSGSPEPQVLLAESTETAIHPVGLAFDAAGSLWVVGTGGTVTRFARESLVVTGAPAPSARFQLTGYAQLATVAFWPRPAGLPLF